jgi:hypothetical protein
MNVKDTYVCITEKESVPRASALIWGTTFNPLNPRDKYMYHPLYQSVTLHFVFVGYV